MSKVFTVRSVAHLLTLPTIITLSRLFIIPLIILFFYVPFEQGRFYAGVLFLFGAATDWLDGFIARRFNMVSSFGAVLDTVADKLLVAVTLVILVEVYAQFWIVLPALIIIAREILISALREWMAVIGQQAQVKVSIWGKLKTFVQMIAIFWLMVMPHDASDLMISFAAIVLYVAMGLTVWSMIKYLQAAWPILSNKNLSGEPLSGEPLNGDPLNGGPLNGGPLNGQELVDPPSNDPATSQQSPVL